MIPIRACPCAAQYIGIYSETMFFIPIFIEPYSYRMAPEVVKNESYSAKVDIWSLGCTVIEMFTGQRPWLQINQIAALYNVSVSYCLIPLIARHA